jgi:hypothetical protein
MSCANAHMLHAPVGRGGTGIARTTVPVFNDLGSAVPVAVRRVRRCKYRRTVAQEHLQRVDVERALAGYADGPRRRRVLQRRARAGRAAGAALSGHWARELR